MLWDIIRHKVELVYRVLPARSWCSALGVLLASAESRLHPYLAVVVAGPSIAWLGKWTPPVSPPVRFRLEQSAPLSGGRSRTCEGVP